jgi:hypothetical protein
MYFRRKQSQGRIYLQIVESHRSGEQVRQRVIATLGRLDELEASGQLDRLLRSGARFVQQAMVLDAARSGEAPAVTVRHIGPARLFERLWVDLSNGVTCGPPGRHCQLKPASVSLGATFGDSGSNGTIGRLLGCQTGQKIANVSLRDSDGNARCKIRACGAGARGSVAKLPPDSDTLIVDLGFPARAHDMVDTELRRGVPEVDERLGLHMHCIPRRRSKVRL